MLFSVVVVCFRRLVMFVASRVGCCCGLLRVAWCLLFLECCCFFSCPLRVVAFVGKKTFCCDCCVWLLLFGLVIAFCYDLLLLLFVVGV